MIECLNLTENKFTPDNISIFDVVKVMNDDSLPCIDEHTKFVRIEPYIEILHAPVEGDMESVKRLIFHEDYHWDTETEDFFEEYFMENEDCILPFDVMDRIYKIYSARYPDWKLKRYYCNSKRILDHIYHCFKKNTAREMLYKAGLDEHAVSVHKLEEINLLASKPSDLYDGLPVRILRALNCKEGSRLLLKSSYREFLKKLQMMFPEIFMEKFNDAQSKYLKFLIDGDTLPGEAGRLFLSRRKDLEFIWNDSQYDLFLVKEYQRNGVFKVYKKIQEFDPFYKDHLEKPDRIDSMDLYSLLEKCLLTDKEEFDKRIRRSNRRRDYSWQERDCGFIVRYPQTANDFMKEAVYMRNCLYSYIYAYMEGDTTLLFVRREEEPNVPYITMEIYNNTLMQAYHRFNIDCNEFEAEWIRDYCDRHGIRRGNFSFGLRDDDLA